MAQDRLPSKHLRLATKKDVPELCRVEEAATVKYGAIPELAFLLDDDIVSAEQTEGWLTQGQIWVYEREEGHISGFVAAHRKDSVLYIAELDVLPEENGKGIGTLLVETVKDWARKQIHDGHSGSGSGTVARVSLTTYPDIPWTGPFYRKRGFVEVDPETIGPDHVKKMMTDENERRLVQPGYRRCCMLWEDR